MLLHLSLEPRFGGYFVNCVSVDGNQENVVVVAVRDGSGGSGSGGGGGGGGGCGRLAAVALSSPGCC